LLAIRIRNVFPHAKVLVSIREQSAIIMSNYMQYLKFGGWHTPEVFLNPPSDTRQPVLTLRYWDYAKLTELYHELFGHENVLVLPQELMRKSPLEFVSRIASFAGVKQPDHVEEASIEVNPRRSHVAYYYLRRLSSLHRKSSANSYFPSVISPPIGRVIDSWLKHAISALTPESVENRVEKSLNERIREVVGAYYAISNRLTCKLIQTNLAELGYQCEP
jgi:hypothetical protein